MMNYKEFCDYLAHHAADYFPKETGKYQLEIHHVVKNNGSAKMGISIRQDGMEAAPMLYAEDLYKDYMRGMPLEDMLEKMFQALFYAQLPPSMPNLRNFEEVKDKIGFALINYDLNKEKLQDCVWTSVENLAKVYKVTYKATFENEEHVYAAAIPKELFQDWGISLNELDRLAVVNMEREFPPVLLDFIEVGGNEGSPASGPKNLLQDNTWRRKHKEPIFVLTNLTKSMGAAAMLYPGVLENISEMVGDDLMLIPSSTDELFVLSRSAGIPPKEIGIVLRAINKSLPKENVLSDRIYEFRYAESKIQEIPESAPPIKMQKREKDRGAR
ncbi:MAG: DUF5688 family protein [Clostridia bacterium]